MPKPRDPEPHHPTTPPKPRTGWFVLTLALITFAIFGRILFNDFTWWDDHQTIHQNPDLNPPSFDKTLHYWRAPHMGLYVPMTYTTWAAVASIAYDENPGRFNIHLDPTWFHAASLLVHTLTTLAVFALLRRLVNGDLPAFLGALLFSLHPVQVEPVAWTSGLKDLLHGLFSTLALWQYVRFAHPSHDLPSPSGRGQGEGGQEVRTTRHAKTAYALSLLLFLLALLSKPSAVMFPAIAGLLDYFLIRRPLRNVILALSPFLLFSLAIAIITKTVQTPFHAEPAPIYAKPLIALDAIAFYLYKLLLPFSLAPDYGRRPTYVLSSGVLYFSWLLPAAVAFLLWKSRRTTPFLLTGALILVAAIFPVLGLVPFEFQAYSTTADHYLYLALLGPALIVAWLLSRHRSLKTIAATSVILTLYATISVAQAGHWTNDHALWSHTLKVNPRSSLAALNLGVEYARRRDPHNAGRMYALAVELNPDFLNARDALAGYYVSVGRFPDAADQLKELVSRASALPPRARPKLGGPYNKLGEVMLQLRKPAEAAVAFQKALDELNGAPGSDQVRANLVRARTQLPSTAPADTR